MSVDDKLKGWRDATETLAPSPQVMAALAKTVEAQAPTASAAPGVVGTVVKVLIVVAIVGAIGFAITGSRDPRWSWSGHSGDADLSKCPARLSSIAGALVDPVPASPLIIAGAGRPRGDAWDESQRLRLQERRATVEARPMTCLAQRQPILEMMMSRRLPEPEEQRLGGRLAYLCGPFTELQIWNPTAHVDGRHCDDSDWCHAPKCLGFERESCAREQAAFPSTSCIGQSGRSALGLHACARFLAGRGSEDEVKQLDSDGWCLSPETLAEAQRLRAGNVPPFQPQESP